jgi:Tfp pilus assembly protein FimT
MKINLEGNRKLIAGVLSVVLVFVAALVNPKLFTTGEMSFGMTIVSIMGLIGGSNVLEWFAKRPVSGAS